MSPLHSRLLMPFKTGTSGSSSGGLSRGGWELGRSRYGWWSRGIAAVDKVGLGSSLRVVEEVDRPLRVGYQLTGAIKKAVNDVGSLVGGCDQVSSAAERVLLGSKYLLSVVGGSSCRSLVAGW